MQSFKDYDDTNLIKISNNIIYFTEKSAECSEDFEISQENRNTEIIIGDVYSVTLDRGYFYTHSKRNGLYEEIPGILLSYLCNTGALAIIIKNVKKMFPEYLIYLQERIKEGEMNPGEIIYPPE